MKKTLLKKYAELIVRSGVALKKGDSVYIRCEIEIEDFVAMVVEECYRRGAKKVYVQWSSPKTERIAWKKGKKEELAKIYPMQEGFMKWRVDENPAMIYLASSDPDGMKGLDVMKMAYVNQQMYAAMHPYIEKMENRYKWCIAGVPGAAWAQKVFPGLSKRKAIEKLWEAILYTSRADDGNGVANWEKHDEDLKKRCDYLNSLHLKSLKYKSSNGTDFEVGLIPGVIFLGGGEKNLDGEFYQPNIPSEECFTSPMKGQAEGIVYSTKPLSYHGQLIKNFWVKFHEGKAIDVGAEEGEEALRSILTMDEGSAYLGECALVPFDSPINNTGILFYNTLFDENAACHLALGRGFTNLYPDFQKYTEEEIHNFGINKSMSHVDFMIGSQDLSIVGTTEDGKEVAIFKDGNWAF